MGDHKPLTAILGPMKGKPSLAAARLQTWALLLSAYEYEIKSMITVTQIDCPDCLCPQRTYHQKVSVFSMWLKYKLCQSLSRRFRKPQAVIQFYQKC
jgi:hypothetical protein